jgi:copper ion binding protein
MHATFTVEGMTCDHCVKSVTEEVSKIAGVTKVAVDLDNGSVTVDSDVALDRSDVAAAVEEAGYELVG